METLNSNKEASGVEPPFDTPGEADKFPLMEVDGTVEKCAPPLRHTLRRHVITVLLHRMLHRPLHRHALSRLVRGPHAGAALTRR